MRGWVGRILRRDSCVSGSSWSKVSLLSIRFVVLPLCRPLLPCPSRWHGCLPRHGLWWLTCELHCSPLLWRLGSVYQLWRIPLLICALQSSEAQTELPACLNYPSVSTGALFRVVNSHVNKMSDGHWNVVNRYTYSRLYSKNVLYKKSYILVCLVIASHLCH